MKIIFPISDFARQQLRIKASFISKLLFVIALVQLFYTLYYPIGPNTDPTEVYIRNFSSVIALFTFGIFLNDWSYILKHTIHSSKTMRRHRILTALTSAIFIGRIAASSFYAVKHLIHLNFIGLYYLADVIAWIAISIFLGHYIKSFKKTAVTEKSSNHKSVT